jgi:hypothetical protein
MKNIKKYNKKGLSTVIATVLIILLVVVSVGIVWGFVKNIVEGSTKSTTSCFDVESSNKVALNSYYTCYNSTSGEVQFSINIEDVEIDELVISILSEGSSKSFTLTNDEANFTNLRPYKGNYGDYLKLPGKNEGLTYVVSGFSGGEKIDSIKIAPVVDGEQCSTSDQTSQVDSCVLLAN